MIPATPAVATTQTVTAATTTLGVRDCGGGKPRPVTGPPGRDDAGPRERVCR